jgi:hypothetical protein
MAVFREKKKEKEREDLWKRLDSIQLNSQITNNAVLAKVAT